MTNSVLNRESAFIVGPPAAGKTTIGREVARQIGAEFHTIDDWTSYVYSPSRQSEPMSDAQVNEALSLLFSDATWHESIYEFAHHDYVGLLRQDIYPVFAASRKVIVVASLETCHARNNARPGRVRSSYVDRTWHSAQSLINLCSSQNGRNAMVVDTTFTTTAAIVPTVVEFLTSRRQNE